MNRNSGRPNKAATIRRLSHVIIVAIAMSAGAALADTRDDAQPDRAKTVSENYIVLAGLSAEERAHLQQLRQQGQKTTATVRKYWKQQRRALRSKRRPHGRARNRRR